ncbi:MAG: hypothetical protein ACR2RL_01520, partial [Gammaproteobacteria bacterium]
MTDTGGPHTGHEQPSATPTRRGARWLRRLIVWPLALLLVVVVGALALMYTATGTRWLVRTAEQVVGAGLEIGEVEGTLGDAFELRHVVYEIAPHRVAIDSVAVVWHPAALLEKRLHIENVTVTGVAYLGPPPESSPESPGAPGLDFDLDLPLEIQLDRLVVARVTLRQGDDAAPATVLDNLQADDLLAFESASVGRVVASSFGIDAELQGELGLETPNPLALKTKWRYALGELAPGELLSGEGELTGRLREIGIQHRLNIGDSPATLGVSGVVALAAGELYPSLDLEASWRELRWPLSGPKADFESREGALIVRGVPRSFALDLAGAVQLHDVPLESVALTAEGGFDPDDPLGPSRLKIDWTVEPGDAAPAVLERAAGRGTWVNEGAVLRIQHHADAPLVLELSAEIERKDTASTFGVENIERFDVQARWRELIWPSSEPAARTADFASEQGQVTLTGSPSAFTLALDAQAAFGEVVLDAVDIKANAELDPAQPLTSATAELDWRVQPRAGGPLSVDEVSGRSRFSVREQGRRLELEHRSTTPFDIDLAAFVTRKSVRAAIAPEDIDNVDVELSWRDVRWPLTGEARYASRDGELKLSGTPDDLTLTLESNLGGEGGSPTNLPVRAVGLSARGAVEPGAPYEFDLEIDWRAALDPELIAEVTPLAGAGRFAGDATHLRMDHALSVPYAITTSGDVALEGPLPQLDLKGGWRDVTWPPGGGAFRSATGDYSVAGALDDLALKVSAALTGEAVPDTDLDLQAQVRPDGAPRFDLALRALGATAAIAGSVDWSAAPAFDLALSADDLDPGKQWSGADGNLSLRAQATGTLAEEGPQVTLRLDRLDGQLRGQPVAGAGVLGLAGSTLNAS